MRKIIPILIIIFSVQVISCEKDKPIIIDNDCIEIPPSSSPYGYDYLNDSLGFHHPCFNPNNSNEIIYIQYLRGVTGYGTLIKYNIVSKEKEIILQGREIVSPPDWSVNNYIVLSLDYLKPNIYKMKSNGDSLTQLTFDDKNIHPYFIDNDTKIVYSDIDHRNTNIISLNSTPLDTIKIFSHAGYSYNNNTNELLICSYEKIYRYNIIDKSYREYCQNYQLIFASRCLWINNFEFIWSTSQMSIGGSVNITNVLTHQTHIIKPNCSSTIYCNINYSELNDKLILVKRERKKISNNLIAVKNKIVIMNTDGTNEQIIEIK